MSGNSIANETISQKRTRQPFSLYRFLTNKYFLYCVSVVLFLSLWDYVAREKIFRDSLARPLEVWDQLVLLTQIKFAGTHLWGHIWASLQRVLIGFVLASVVAIPLGLFMALNKYVNAIVKPLFDLFKPMPPIAWVSIAILWFGIGETSKVFIIIIGTFVPCLLNAYNGVRLVDPELYDGFLPGHLRWSADFLELRLDLRAGSRAHELPQRHGLSHQARHGHPPAHPGLGRHDPHSSCCLHHLACHHHGRTQALPVAAQHRKPVGLAAGLAICNQQPAGYSGGGAQDPENGRR